MNAIYSNKEVVQSQKHTKVNIFFINCDFDQVLFLSLSFRSTTVIPCLTYL